MRHHVQLIAHDCALTFAFAPPPPRSLFVATNTLSAILFATCYPETKGKTLEEIDRIFGDDAVEELKAEGGAVGSVKSTENYKA